jgi:hypothetical protein
VGKDCKIRRFYDIVNVSFMKTLSSTSMILAAVFLVLGGLIGAAVWQNVRPTGLDSFAQCLTEKGAVMYGAWWCPHCQAQKALFGPSFKYVTEKECGAGKGQFNVAACPGITSTPLWKDKDGKEYKGSQELSQLSEIFACELPK